MSHAGSSDSEIIHGIAARTKFTDPHQGMGGADAAGDRGALAGVARRRRRRAGPLTVQRPVSVAAGTLGG